jgi:hypothetical protein
MAALDFRTSSEGQFRTTSGENHHFFRTLHLGRVYSGSVPRRSVVPGLRCPGRSGRLSTYAKRCNLEEITMTTTIPNRRTLVCTATAGLAALAVMAASGGEALAYQGNMERALSDLQGALRSLREATPDKGGHKAVAASLIEQAIGEVQAGIAYAAEHFGD